MSAKINLKCAHRIYKKAVRLARLNEENTRDKKLFDILERDKNNVFNNLKRCKNSASQSATQKLYVDGLIYEGDMVADGFFESMKKLKTCDFEELAHDPDLAVHFSNYEHIRQLCNEQRSLPEISCEQVHKILKRMKRDVKDHYGITALHYLNAGVEGTIHVKELINCIISNPINATTKEMNTVHGLILHKGHNKDKTSERSYRTISSCPVLSKVLDIYIRDLNQDKWDSCQASTQYQGRGTSHELAALLLTEVIQHSLFILDKPVYILALDAQSAFDRCLSQILVCELYKAGIDGGAIALIDNRLRNRATVYDWNGTLVGPASDMTGFEQGGVNSSDYYKLYNNEQLVTAQRSQLGVLYMVSLFQQ